MFDTKVSIITIIHNNKEFYPLIKQNWENIDYPKENLEWIILDDSLEDHSSFVPLHENILYIRIDPNEFFDKIDFKDDDEKIVWNYHKKLKKLPNGFMRDYAVGLTSNDYILHMDIDTIYQPKTLKRKLRFLIDHKLDCVYCKSMLCYDIYAKQLYKTENNFAYESTLLHTKDLWKKGGFNWSDTHSEAINFYYNKGNERKMDNFYDTIKILSIKNINNYRPVKITLENIDIKIPDILNDLKLNEHPIKDELNDLFFKNEINVLGINSEIASIIKGDNKWDIINVNHENKSKEKVLIKTVQSMNTKFNLCFLNTKIPIWNIFDKINFDCIVIESEKNTEQMASILVKKNYINFNYLYIHKDYLLK